VDRILFGEGDLDIVALLGEIERSPALYRNPASIACDAAMGPKSTMEIEGNTRGPRMTMLFWGLQASPSWGFAD
jgi:hypothetical protein